jgi:hypothetical protein
VRLSTDFFALQLLFARKISSVGELPIADSLSKHSCLREIFGLRRSHNYVDETCTWQNIIKKIAAEEKPASWLQQHYSLLNIPRPYNKNNARYGPFSYALTGLNGHIARLLFFAQAVAFPLRSEFLADRRNDLSMMFKDVKLLAPGVLKVRGGSWLYNINAYRRIFPPVYVASAKPNGYETDSMALWGQFLLRNGDIRAGEVTKFLTQLNLARTVSDCLLSFPLEVLRPECDIGAFSELRSSIEY